MISAVGQLNRPLLPDIKGRDSFAGPSFHSARWDHSVDLRGKRVAVIGTGASAVQFIPEIADDVEHLVVFQRTPPWMGPTPEYHDEVPAGLRWLYAHVPSYSEWNRFWIFWKMGDGALPGVRVDPAWEPKDRSVSAMNDMMRAMLTAYLEAEFADRPDLLPKVVPDYPPGAKRVLRDNGVWAGALKRDNVELVTEPIREITSNAVVTEDGVEHSVDVIVYGTGFHASKFLMPMTVSGRRCRPARTVGRRRARLPRDHGAGLPEPLLSLRAEHQHRDQRQHRLLLGVRGALRARLHRAARRDHHRALDVRKDVHDAFNERVDAENRNMAWGHSSVNSWYKSESGRIAQNWPFTLLEYWQRTCAPDPAGRKRQVRC